MNNLPAGPELDRLVADKVMGWRPETSSDGKYERWNKNDHNGGAWYAIKWNRERHGEDWFSPSTNIEHAREVVSRIRRNVLHVSVGGPLKVGEELPQYFCKIEGFHTVSYAVADTDSLAICYAALRMITP